MSMTDKQRRDLATALSNSRVAIRQLKDLQERVDALGVLIGEE